MQRYNRGAALAFVIILIVIALAIAGVYRRVEGRYQARAQELASYSLDDWINLLNLDDLVGEPPITPLPADQMPIRATPTP